MKRIIHIILLIIVVCSCSHEPEVINNNKEQTNNSTQGTGTVSGYAPSNVVNKEFRFYFDGKTSWSFKALPGDKMDNGMVLTSSSYAVVTNSVIDYTKTGNNTATIYCGYTTTFSNGYGSYTLYDFNLTFISAIQGVFTGKFLDNPMSENGKDVSGVFMYNSNQEPQGFTGGGGASLEQDIPGTEEDLAKIVGKWQENVDKSQPGWSLSQTIYSFKENGEYSCYYGVGTSIHNGTFTCKNNTITIKVDSSVDNTITVGSKKQLQLNNGNLIDGTKTYSKVN